MSRAEARNRVAKSEYLMMNLRCAVRARDTRWSPIGGMSTSEQAIDTLRAAGYIQCARAYTKRLGEPMPMGGWVATKAGCEIVVAAQ